MNKQYSDSRILIVDDQLANTNLLESFLKINGYVNYTTTNDSREVPQLVEANQPDLILLDIMMPHLSGIDILRWLREKLYLDGPLRVMVLTADVTKETLKEVLKEGAHDMLRKPFDFIELELRLHNLLHTNWMIKQLNDQSTHLSFLVDQRTAEITQKNEELEQFIYVASHDTQEPLRMITGFLQLLEKKYGEKLDDKGKEYIHFAIDGAHRMKMLIKDMLDFSRADRLNLGEPEEVEISDIIDDLKISLSRLLQETNTELTVERIPTINAFSAPLRQVLQNLLVNGINYQPKGQVPCIQIYSNETESEIVICVKDNGIGISKENQKKIFDMFTRLHRKEEYAGSGIGLSISKKLMEKMGGSISIDSELGKGSVFSLHFPK
ncbi:MAG: ATP-binding protein [Flavobacteriia bacterium]